ncbi:major capsid protein [Acinetobacter ursingii]|uniref:major capsid protein n=1 Tax=Acinetobacter ursingii TaxID=108980 RepID=UPI003AF92DE9
MSQQEIQELIVSEQVNSKRPKAALHRKAFAGLLAVIFSTIAAPAFAAVDLGIDASELQSLILGLIATIALLGTAYLTVLVATSAFGMIRRVIRG